MLANHEIDSIQSGNDLALISQAMEFIKSCGGINEAKTALEVAAYVLETCSAEIKNISSN